MKAKLLEQAVPRAIRAQRATGVLTTACLYKEIERNRETPNGRGGPQTGRPRGTGRAAWVADRFVAPRTPRNSG